MKMCLYNTYSDNIAGYCHHHHCSMTPQQITARNCRQKQCNYMEKNLEHEWWAQLERKKQKRKARKERLNTIVGR